MPLACQLIVQLACSRWPTAKAGQWAKAEQSLGGQTIRRSREKNRTARRVVVRRGCASVAKPPGPVPPLVHSASSHTRLFFIRWNQGPARRVGRGGGGQRGGGKGALTTLWVWDSLVCDVLFSGLYQLSRHQPCRDFGSQALLRAPEGRITSSCRSALHSFPSNRPYRSRCCPALSRLDATSLEVRPPTPSPLWQRRRKHC
jgi:hypothetical protein